MIPKILFASSFVLGFSLVAQPALAEPGHYICGYTGVVTTDNRCPHGKTPWLISAEPPSPSASPTTSTPPSTRQRGTSVKLPFPNVYLGGVFRPKSCFCFCRVGRTEFAKGRYDIKNKKRFFPVWVPPSPSPSSKQFQFFQILLRPNSNIFGL